MHDVSVRRTGVTRPATWIEACTSAHRRLLRVAADLDDEAAARPSRLEGWSRGHVLSHLARNADSHTWLFEGARAGEVRSQYPSVQARTEGIEAGASRPARALLGDLTRSVVALEAAWAAHDDDEWDRTGITTPGTRTMAELVFRRLREVEVHTVDLDCGITEGDWSATYVDGELERRLRDVSDRCDPAELVAWLLGRGPAPELGPW